MLQTGKFGQVRDNCTVRCETSRTIQPFDSGRLFRNVAIYTLRLGVLMCAPSESDNVKQAHRTDEFAFAHVFGPMKKNYSPYIVHFGSILEFRSHRLHVCVCVPTMGEIVDVTAHRKFGKSTRLENAEITVDDDILRFSSVIKTVSYKIHPLRKTVRVTEGNLLSIRLAAEKPNKRGSLKIYFHKDPQKVVDLINDHVDKHPEPKEKLADRYSDWMNLYKGFLIHGKNKKGRLGELEEETENIEREGEKEKNNKKLKKPKKVGPRKIIFSPEDWTDDNLQEVIWPEKTKRPSAESPLSVNSDDIENVKKPLKRAAVEEPSTRKYPKRIKRESLAMQKARDSNSVQSEAPAQKKRSSEELVVKQELVEESFVEPAEIVVPQNAILPGAEIQNQHIVGERLFGSNVSYSRLDNCHVTDSTLTNCTIQQSTLLRCTIERE